MEGFGGFSTPEGLAFAHATARQYGVVAHSQGNGNPGDLRELIRDLEFEGFSVTVLRLPGQRSDNGCTSVTIPASRISCTPDTPFLLISTEAALGGKSGKLARSTASQLCQALQKAVIGRTVRVGEFATEVSASARRLEAE